MEKKDTSPSTNAEEVSKSVASDITNALDKASSKEVARPEVSGAAIARMMGIVTTSELKLLEGKLDLMSGRLNTLVARTEKIVTQFNQMPTGGDLERIDVQIGALKTTIRDLAVLISGSNGNSAKTARSSAVAQTEIVTPEEEEAKPE